MSEQSVSEYLAKEGQRITNEIKQYLKDKSSDEYIWGLLGKSPYVYDHQAINKSILEPAWYLLSQGGKRLRAVLTMLLLDSLGANSEDYKEFAIIPEIIHNATLILDDIEDGSKMRRNAPCVHIKFGLDIAVNLANFLLYFPIVALMSSNKLDNSKKDKLLSIYVKEMLRIGTGQAIDIAWHNSLVDIESITEEEYLQTAFDKTGVLTRFSAELAGILAGVDEATFKALGDFGAAIGVVFQIKDDMLNISSSKLAESKGGIGEDITEGKVTLALIYALKLATPEDKRKLLSIIKSHTTNMEEISEAIAIMQKYNVENKLKATMSEIMNAAWLSLKPILKDSPSKDKLSLLVDFIMERNY
ncbi:MAG: polyprenyl synthetase family protein [Candidatus Micrarchaeia archaeon]